jgi:hypothetical protein
MLVRIIPPTVQRAIEPMMPGLIMVRPAPAKPLPASPSSYPANFSAVEIIPHYPVVGGIGNF